MKVLVVGADGRTHALVWKLFNSDRIDSIASTPGNGGAGLLAPVAPHQGTTAETVRWAYAEQFDVLVAADGVYLEEGMIDEATPLQIAAWGPPRRSALLGRSRLWAKEFLQRYKIPTAPGRACGDRATAERYVAAQSLPLMLWGDYPSEYDGAYHDRATALAALDGIFALPPRPDNFRGVVIESPILGPTVSYSCVTDGTTLLPLLPVRIYDRLEDGDAGWAAAGMGAHTSSTPLLTRLSEYMQQRIMQPLLAALQHEHLPWWGLLGVDCTVTAHGPLVTRIRCAFNEGEAQVVLPRLQDDLLTLIAACNNRSLHTLPPIRWQAGASVGVTLVAEGYPHAYPTQLPITGLAALEPGVLAFHSETTSPTVMPYVSVDVHAPEKRSLLLSLSTSFSEAMLVRPSGPSQLITEGGRALMVVAVADTLAQARSRVYANLAHLTMPRSFHRSDIAAREL